MLFFKDALLEKKQAAARKNRAARCNISFEIQTKKLKTKVCSWEEKTVRDFTKTAHLEIAMKKPDLKGVKKFPLL